MSKGANLACVFRLSILALQERGGPAPRRTAEGGCPYIRIPIIYKSLPTSFGKGRTRVAFFRKGTGGL